MPHSYYNIWLHLVFSTKDRRPLISDIAETPLYKYMSEQLVEYGCIVKIINGMSDHVHCLYLQNPNRSIAETVKFLKGASSHWINQENFVPVKFAWQKGYSVFSVSESQVKRVHQYILNQKKHHAKRTFEKEVDEMLRSNNIITNNLLNN